MQFFYNSAGDVIAMVDAEPSVEAGFSMDGHTKVAVPAGIAALVNNPFTPETHEHYHVVKGKVIKKAQPPPPLKKDKAAGFRVTETKL